ncbi:MAG TPA: S1/P1 nuclease [Nitrospinae bacterium]|nr:S1/P1 nuclease [Nitrospinota bacterium]
MWPPKQKKIVAEELNIKNLADIATWADKTRRNRKQETPWHYTNVKEGEWTYRVSRDCPKRNCVIEKIKEFSAVLENVKLSLKRRKVALKYLVHFVGDVHQPLHLGNRKDQSGGKIRLTYLGKSVTPHYFWDGGLIDWEKENLLKCATRLNAQLQDLDKSKWLHSKVNDWADESRSLALKYAYPLENNKLSKTYISKGREILDQRMVQAGIRLANLLNQLLKNKNLERGPPCQKLIQFTLNNYCLGLI